MKAIDYYKSKIENFEEMSFEDRRYWLEYKCLDKSKMHTKATLKGLFRLKPTKDAIPCGSYTNDYKQEIDLYYPIDCVPMRNVSKKARSEAQKQATEKLVAATFKNSKKGRAVDLCKKLIASGAVVIDTETTDLDGVAIQIAVVACDTREVLYSSLIATDEPISKEAYEVHRISENDLIGAPTAADVCAAVMNVCRGRDVVAFNAYFDAQICRRTFGDEFQASWICAMYKIAVPVLGSTNRYGTISLKNALKFADVQWRGQAHDARGDAIATADLIHKISTIQP